VTPTARTLEYCKKNNIAAGVVERYNHIEKRRYDLFGFLDIIAIEKGQLIGIQTTSHAGNAGARIRKIQNECKENAALWLATGATIEVWSWRKRKKGRMYKDKHYFQLVRQVVTL
jgi:hypothetical protein